MSRIGIKPITVENGVTVELSKIEAVIKGNNNQTVIALPHGVKVSQKDSQLSVERIGDTKQYRSLHGTIRALLQNAITGVSKGFEKRLELIGIGFRGAIEGNDLVLQLGFTHPVRVAIPSSLHVKLEKNVIIVSGHDKQEVGQFSAVLRSMRKPDPYKGKGIRYQGEIIRMKQGKATKSGS